MKTIETLLNMKHDAENEDGRITDYDLNNKMCQILYDKDIEFDVRENYTDCGPGYESTFYVISFIEDEELCVVDFLVESY